VQISNLLPEDDYTREVLLNGVTMLIFVVVLVGSYGLALFLMLITGVSVQQEGSAPSDTLRLQKTFLTPELALEIDKSYHLFISHNWDNQDAAATIKRQLQRLLPHCAIFLDIDDLVNVNDLEANVAASGAMLILLGSTHYFRSHNCKREMLAAQAHKVPLILVHESNPTKNGAPLSDLKEACPDELRDFVFGRSKPSAHERQLANARPVRRNTAGSSSHREVIAWHRTIDFQLVSLAQIGEQLLLASPLSAAIHSKDGLHAPL
jgi:hypothetical protein